MSGQTQELELYKYDGSTDGELFFNLDDGLNENWEKIDAAIKDTRNRIRLAVSDLAALKAIDTTPIYDKALIMVEMMGLYRLNKESISVGDDDVIVAPTTGAGRWIKIAEASVGHTIDDTQVPTGDNAKSNKLLSWLANMIKSITGEGTWRTPPKRSIRQLIVPYAVTTNVGNAYSAAFDPALTALTDGQPVVIKCNANQTAAGTLKPNALGAVPLKKANGSDILNMKAGGIYSFRYNETTANFILQGEGGEYGTAGAAQTLIGYTTGAENGLVNGTMPNRGSVGTIILDAEGEEYTIAEGYHNGLGKIKATIAGLIAGVIKAGATVGGILGTFTADATAQAQYILTGNTAYVNGEKITGTMSYFGGGLFNWTDTDKLVSIERVPTTIYSAVTMKMAAVGYIDQNSTYKINIYGLVPEYIAAGAKIGGVPNTGEPTVVGTYTADATAAAGNILAAKTAYVNGAKVTGTMPNYTGQYKEAYTTDGVTTVGRLYVRPYSGYYDGVYSVTVDDPDYIPPNIIEGANIFGLAGTAKRFNFAKGTFTIPTTNNYNIPITVTMNLTFTPKAIMITSQYGSFAVQEGQYYPVTTFGYNAGFWISNTLATVEQGQQYVAYNAGNGMQYYYISISNVTPTSFTYTSGKQIVTASGANAFEWVAIG